jgi:hypothetical protein
MVKLHTKYRIAPLAPPKPGDATYWTQVTEAVRDATVMPWDGVMPPGGEVHQHEAGGAVYRAVFDGSATAMIYVTMTLPG